MRTAKNTTTAGTAHQLDRSRDEYVRDAREWIYIARTQRRIGQHAEADMSLRRVAGLRRAAFVTAGVAQ